MSFQDQVRVGVAKGCLAGFGLALLFLLSGGLLYFAGIALGLERGVALVVGIAGGPIIVSALVLGGIVVRSRSRLGTYTDDAATSRDEP